jgi:hypothetical protein
MSRKRSSYRPKPVYLNAFERACQRAAVLEPVDRDNLKAIVRTARDAFLRGDDPRGNWKALADCFNTAEALCEARICSDEESVSLIDGAHEVLGDVWARQNAGGSWTLRAAEIAALDAAIERHLIQLDHCSLGEFEAAREKVRRRTVQALNGNAAPGVVVYGGA